MLSGVLGESAQALPVTEAHELRGPDDRQDGEEKPSTANAGGASRRGRDKIICLDGLRGIACLLVFNYHFLWPWTPSIMLGHGALPPQSPEPYLGWPFMPIICLLHRGRPMVAIFFAISGYVLCRHILKAIQERRLDAAYKSLASAVFRRAFRLYIPPAISMFIVAMLAQMGAFRSEEDVYMGVDSKYINGTVTIGRLGPTCMNGTIPVVGMKGAGNLLHLEDISFLKNVTGNTTSNWSSDRLCLNATSERFGPSSLYNIMNDTEQYDWKVAMGMEIPEPQVVLDHKGGDYARKTSHQARAASEKAKSGSKSSDTKGGKSKSGVSKPKNVGPYDKWKWIQMGGSWEEHPFIHDNTTYALQNFTRAYAEWANPFNFGHYHPRYDPHTFTIPMELRGSMFLYVFLLGTAALKTRFRLGFGWFLVAYSLQLGRWDMAIFMGGMLQSEMDLRRVSGPGSMGRQGGFGRSTLAPRAFRWGCIILALYFLSYPDAGAEFTPGFMFLSEWVPRYYIPLSGWMFYQGMGALILLPCILRSASLRRLLETSVAQYLGKISFSFYLVHGPVLHSLGFWIMPRLFDRFSWLTSLAIGYVTLLPVSLYLANWWHKKVDVWSMGVGKRVEAMLLD
ncbi:hypothetical protein N3K66_000776 [Trichothecium roseum]|uniref:Uncharacterized protein n=1 Tax=Trichothecium roseum TaxID=47278 RepID=A0ACC0VCY1_9HYPO|nr:hypothetical protein N3K66_000776 [Trichothecium roseum]